MNGALGGSRSAIVPRMAGPRSLALLCALAALAACEVGTMSAADPPRTSATPGARDASRMRVIAKLRLDPADAALGQTDAAAKATQIAAVRERLLASLPPAEVRLTRAFASIPFVALEVSPAGFAALRASPLVLGVEEDRVESVQGGASTGGPAGPARPAGTGLPR